MRTVQTTQTSNGTRVREHSASQKHNPTPWRTVTETFRSLWTDDHGAVVAAETALVGTIAVLGVGAGLHEFADATNRELTEVSRAIRSLDQSYAYSGFRGAGAATAGSAYVQEDVAISLRRLGQSTNEPTECDAAIESATESNPSPQGSIPAGNSDNEIERDQLRSTLLPETDPEPVAVSDETLTEDADAILKDLDLP